MTTLSTETKPILLVDFDGVIHSYTSGWSGADNVDDPPVEGAYRFLKEAIKYFDVQIYSSRTRQQGGVRAMQEWMLEHFKDESLVFGDLSFPQQKPAAFLTIDDRCVCFNGTFCDPKQLIQFKPWNKQGV